MSNGAAQAEEDRQQIRRLAESYAYLADSGDDAGFAALFVDGAVLITPMGRMEEGDVFKIPSLLKQLYARTLHIFLSQHLVIELDEAWGETRGLAHHMIPGDAGAASLLTWTIRYQDRFCRTADGWRFAQRDLQVDWSETRQVRVGADIAGLTRG